MGMINCPNCGKRILDDERCVYCKSLLKKKVNPFDSEKYQYLKREYVKAGNKAAAIKKGMDQFGISMQEAKEIVDFIADEVYEEGNVRSKEQVDRQLVQGNEYYKFSFGAYFIHTAIYHIVIEVLLVCAILFCRDQGIIREYPIVVGIWCILEVVFVLYIGKRFFRTASTSFAAESGNFVYKHKIPELRGNDNNRSSQYRRTYIYYRMNAITKVEERLNSFVIYGNITKEEARHVGIRLDSTKTKKLDSVKVPKCFRKNRELIEKLKQ